MTGRLLRPSKDYWRVAQVGRKEPSENISQGNKKYVLDGTFLLPKLNFRQGS
jgi:hypothetical protein